MNRIDKEFKKLKAENKKAFIPFIVAGLPDFKATKKIILELARQGASVIELGVPFSDPLADGSIIQQAANKALEKGVTLKKILDFVKDIRKDTDVPIALFSYCNPLFYYGSSKLIRDCRNVGIDGLIIPDLPPDEAKEFSKEAKKNGLKTIFLVTPTSGKERTKRIASLSDGFIYYVSVTGITGPRKKLPTDIKKHIEDLRKITKKPICIGFGISTPQHVKDLRDFSDGIIIGSAIVKLILKANNHNQIIKNISNFVVKIQGAL